jgi:diguanylate cyclase (GGDEF)-like protein
MMGMVRYQLEGGILGLLHVIFNGQTPETREADALFAQRLSEQLGLARANFRLRETLRFEAMQDSLTGLFNRRFLELSLKREFARAAREQTNVAVMMLDVDHFKRFNDVHGHDAGDIVLCQLGQVLTESCRAADLACRFGGEEFTMVMPGSTREAMTARAEHLLGRVRAMQVVSHGQLLSQITVSIGIAFFPEHGEETTKVIQAADQALYAAKRAGRNRVVVSGTIPASAAEVGEGAGGGAG